MLARVVWKLTLAFCVILAVALAALWLRTRGSGRDLVVSGARGGTYGELRFGGGRAGVTLIPRWPVNERLRAGRPVARNNPKDVYLPSSRVPPAPAQPGQLALLDGSRLTLQTTTPATWLAWPPARSAGTAYVEGALEKHLKFSGGFSSVAASVRGTNTLTGIIVPSTAPASAAAAANATTAPINPPASTLTFTGSAVVTIAPPTTSPAGAATMPTLVVSGGQGGVAAATANAVIASLKNDANLAFRTAPVATTAPAAFPLGSTVAFTNVYLVPTYAFERYAMPLAPLIVIVLLPVWIALAAASFRTARRGIRRRKGLCEACGYDLRGSPAGGACPECGAAPAGDDATEIPREVVRARLQA